MNNAKDSYKKQIEQVENKTERLKAEIKLLTEKQGALEINDNGKTVNIIPTGCPKKTASLENKPKLRYIIVWE